MDSGSPIALISTIVIVGLSIGVAYRALGKSLASTSSIIPSDYTTFLGRRQRQGYGYESYGQIPTPRYAFPLFGHIPLLGSSVSLKIYQWHRTYGSLLRLRMGSQNWLLIADPYFAHELFSKHDNQPMTRPYHRFVDEYYSKQRRGLVYSSTDSEKYQDFRSAVLQYLSPDSIDEQLIDYEADSFIERIQQKASNGANNCLDPFWDLKLFCMNVFMSVAFARRYDSTDDPDFIDGEGILDECFPLLGVAGDPGSFVSFLKWIPWVAKSNHSMNKSIQRRDAFFRRFIEHSLNETTSHCLVKALYSIRDKYQLDYDDILVTLSDMNGIASDVPATCLTWSLAILSNHPDIQDRMRQEISTFYQQHGRLPRYSERQNFPFVLSVQKECLRYRCSNSFSVPRQFETDVTCCGILIPKHTVCVCPFHAMHMNESFYEQSTLFNPDRFVQPSTNTACSILDMENADVDDQDVFLFGFGPRRCPGLHMVERHMFSLFVRLFYHCRIQNPIDEQGNRIQLDLNKSSDCGLMLRPLPFTVQVVDLTSTHDDDDGNSRSDSSVDDSFSVSD